MDNTLVSKFFLPLVKFYLMQNTFGVKKMQPSKVELYLKVNAWTNWRQQDLISEYSQGLAYWTH